VSAANEPPERSGVRGPRERWCQGSGDEVPRSRMLGGGGGGRPDFAEAGGKDPSKIDALIAKAPDLIGALL
jgi:DHHA1 domain